METRQVLPPQRRSPAPRGYQRAAAEGAGTEQPALGDQGDQGEHDEQLDPRVGDDTADAGLRVDELVVFLLFRGRLVLPARCLRRSAGDEPGDALREPGQRAPGRDERAHRGVPLGAPGGAHATSLPQRQRVPDQPRDRVELRGRQVQLLGEQEVGRPHERPRDASGDDAQHDQQRQVNREHVQGVAPVKLARIGLRLVSADREALPEAARRRRAESSR